MSRRTDPIRLGVLAVGVIFALVRPDTHASDAYAYWLHSYGLAAGEQGAFLYSPPIAALFAPFGFLPWHVFLAGWTVLLFALLAWLVGPWALPLLLFPPVAYELQIGNVHLLLAAAIVVGFRYPAAWAFVLLTKVTPGIGLLWFAVRREWRSLGIALGVTATIAALSLAIAPDQWRAWITTLGASMGQASAPDQGWMIPLWPRLVVAALVIVWAARSDRRWALPVACWLALPALWEYTPTLLVGSVAIWWRSTRESGPDAGLDLVGRNL